MMIWLQGPWTRFDTFYGAMSMVVGHPNRQIPGPTLTIHLPTSAPDRSIWHLVLDRLPRPNCAALPEKLLSLGFHKLHGIGGAHNLFTLRKLQ